MPFSIRPLRGAPRPAAWLPLAASLILLAVPAAAYEVLLDIDLDDDPATINSLTLQTSCTVRVVLSPTEPIETITEVEFGLGGSCRECDQVHHYGVAHDLHPAEFGDWTDDPDFSGWWDSATYLGCPDTPCFHDAYFCVPVGGSYELSAPIFLASFQAWVAPPPPAGCPVPPANLMAMPQQAQWWNLVQIGGPAAGDDATTWGSLKGLYR